MNAHGREITRLQKPVQLVSTGNALYKNDDLVEFKRIKKIGKHLVLFRFFKSLEVLLETMKSQFRLIVNEYFQWLYNQELKSDHNDQSISYVLHKLFANRTDLL
jgi:hypothetical protein